MLVIPALGRPRPVDPWDSLAGQSSLTSKSQAPVRLNKIRYMALGFDLLPPYAYIPTYIQTLACVCTHHARSGQKGFKTLPLLLTPTSLPDLFFALKLG